MCFSNWVADLTPSSEGVVDLIPEEKLKLSFHSISHVYFLSEGVADLRSLMKISWSSELGQVWTQVGLSVRNLVVSGSIWRRSWAQNRPNVRNMALHEPNLGPGFPLKGPNLGPSWCQVGLKLGPQRSKWAPNWSHVMHMEVQATSKGATGDPLAAASCPVRPNGDTTWSWGTLLQKSEKYQVQVGSQVAPSWSQGGSKLGRSWGLAKGKLGRCCDHVASQRSVWALLRWHGKCMNMCKVRVPQSHALSGGLKMPPKLKLYHADRSVHSLHPLLNYHASAPSVLCWST